MLITFDFTILRVVLWTFRYGCLPCFTFSNWGNLLSATTISVSILILLTITWTALRVVDLSKSFQLGSRRYVFSPRFGYFSIVLNAIIFALSSFQRHLRVFVMLSSLCEHNGGSPNTWPVLECLPCLGVSLFVTGFYNFTPSGVIFVELLWLLSKHLFLRLSCSYIRVSTIMCFPVRLYPNISPVLGLTVSHGGTNDPFFSKNYVFFC